MIIHSHHTTEPAGPRVSEPKADDATATIDSAYRLLVIRGLSPVEAGNVVAFINGLHPAESGWTVDEIKHLVAIRSLVTAGRIES